MYIYSKKIFDRCLAVALILVLAPFLMPIIIGLKLTGEGHIWYFQDRIGYKNKQFKIWKFATMLLNSPNMEGGIITKKNDPRMTPMGTFLRKTKINELPQLINVIKGEMSFVGPRPVMQQSFDQYPSYVKKQLYEIPPGLTGIGSIVFRDEEALISDQVGKGNDPWQFYIEKIYPYKGELESWYQKNQSFSLDMSILACTAWNIVFPKSDLLFKLYPDLPQRDFL